MQLSFIAYCARGINKSEIKDNPQGITPLGWKGLRRSFVFACLEVSESQVSDPSLSAQRSLVYFVYPGDNTCVCLAFKRESYPSKSCQLPGRPCFHWVKQIFSVKSH